MIASLGLATLSACSARQVYDGLQVRERNLCAEGPSRQYEECMARVSMDYDEYIRLDPRPVPEAGRARLAVVRQFTDAFNRHDVNGMLALVAPEMRWMSVAGDQVSTETRNAGELRAGMQDYFEQVPSARSRLLDMGANGPFVTTLEQAVWAEGGAMRSQCATAVYEISGGLILNVWYYPAHACD